MALLRGPVGAAGVNRFTSVQEALRLCPDIAFVHVDVVHDKVSLEAYRAASRTIMTVFERCVMPDNTSICRLDCACLPTCSLPPSLSKLRSLTK